MKMGRGILDPAQGEGLARAVGARHPPVDQPWREEALALHEVLAAFMRATTTTNASLITTGMSLDLTAAVQRRAGHR